jgi:hypothetical protein
MALRTPKYRLHRPSGLAVVTIGGRDHYLGPHGSKESMAEFDRLVGEWMVRGRPDARAASANDRTINEILVDYLRYAEIYYRKPDGRQTSEADCCKLALRPLRAMYGHTRADAFGPLGLKTVREQMIRAGLCRLEINKRVRHIVRMFRWAAENEMVNATVHHALKTVPGLKRGRSEANVIGG